MALQGLDTSDSSFIELLFNYGINRYRSGNNLQGLIFKSAYHGGNLNLLDRDPLGQRLLETPDGHLIMAVDDEVTIEAPLHPDVAPTTVKCERNVLKTILLHVLNS